MDQIERNQSETNKTKSNKSKFQLVSVSAYKPAQVIGQQPVNFTTSTGILGMQFGQRECQHMQEKGLIARTQNRKLKRFMNMNTNIKIHFYKSNKTNKGISTGLASTSNIRAIQKFQNKIQY